MKTDAEEIFQAKSLSPEKEEIVEAVCSYSRVEVTDQFVPRRGQFNEPWDVGIYLLRRLRREQLKVIGKYFHIAKSSSGSSIIERLKGRITKDRNLKKRVYEIFAKIIKSQGQT